MVALFSSTIRDLSLCRFVCNWSRTSANARSFSVKNNISPVTSVVLEPVLQYWSKNRPLGNPSYLYNFEKAVIKTAGCLQVYVSQETSHDKTVEWNDGSDFPDRRPSNFHENIFLKAGNLSLHSCCTCQMLTFASARLTWKSKMWQNNVIQKSCGMTRHIES